MSAIEYGGESFAFKNALRAATSVRVLDRFDTNVLAGINRPLSWRELFGVQLKIVAPAIACGACATLFLMMFAFQLPAVPMSQSSNATPTRVLDSDKLMMLIDRPGQQMASNVLLLDSMVPFHPVASQAVKIEPKVERRASIASPQILV